MTFRLVAHTSTKSKIGPTARSPHGDAPPAASHNVTVRPTTASRRIAASNTAIRLRALEQLSAEGFVDADRLAAARVGSDEASGAGSGPLRRRHQRLLHDATDTVHEYSTTQGDFGDLARRHAVAAAVLHGSKEGRYDDDVVLRPPSAPFFGVDEAPRESAVSVAAISARPHSAKLDGLRASSVVVAIGDPDVDRHFHLGRLREFLYVPQHAPINPARVSNEEGRRGQSLNEAKGAATRGESSAAALFRASLSSLPSVTELIAEINEACAIRQRRRQEERRHGWHPPVLTAAGHRELLAHAQELFDSITELLRAEKDDERRRIVLARMQRESERRRVEAITQRQVRELLRRDAHGSSSEQLAVAHAAVGEKSGGASNAREKAIHDDQSQDGEAPPSAAGTPHGRHQRSSMLRVIRDVARSNKRLHENGGVPPSTDPTDAFDVAVDEGNDDASKRGKYAWIASLLAKRPPSVVLGDNVFPRVAHQLRTPPVSSSPPSGLKGGMWPPRMVSLRQAATHLAMGEMHSVGAKPTAANVRRATQSLATSLSKSHQGKRSALIVCCSEFDDPALPAYNPQLNHDVLELVVRLHNVGYTVTACVSRPEAVGQWIESVIGQTQRHHKFTSTDGGHPPSRADNHDDDNQLDADCIPRDVKAAFVSDPPTFVNVQRLIAKHFQNFYAAVKGDPNSVTNALLVFVGYRVSDRATCFSSSTASEGVTLYPCLDSRLGSASTMLPIGAFVPSAFHWAELQLLSSPASSLLTSNANGGETSPHAAAVTLSSTSGDVQYDRMIARKVHTVADLRGLDGRYGVAFSISGADGGELAFTYPNLIHSRRQLIGFPKFVLISLLCRALRGKAVRDEHRMNLNAIHIFAAERIMQLQWPLYTNCSRMIRTSVDEFAHPLAVPLLLTGLRQFRAQKKRNAMSYRCVKALCLLPEQYSRGLSVVASMLHAQMEKSARRAMDPFRCESFVPLQTQFVVGFRSRDSYDAASAGLIAHMQRMEGVRMTQREVCHWRVGIAVSNPRYYAPLIDATKRYVAENSLSAVLLVPCTMCIFTTLRTARKFNWYARLSTILPEYIEIVCLAEDVREMRRVDAASTLQAWWRELTTRRRITIASLLLTAFHEQCDSLFAACSNELSHLVANFHLDALRATEEVETSVRHDLNDELDHTVRMLWASFIERWSSIVIYDGGGYWYAAPVASRPRRSFSSLTLPGLLPHCDSGDALASSDPAAPHSPNTTSMSVHRQGPSPTRSPYTASIQKHRDDNSHVTHQPLTEPPVSVRSGTRVGSSESTAAQTHNVMESCGLVLSNYRLFSVAMIPMAMDWGRPAATYYNDRPLYRPTWDPHDASQRRPLLPPIVRFRDGDDIKFSLSSISNATKSLFAAFDTISSDLRQQTPMAFVVPNEHYRNAALRSMPMDDPAGESTSHATGIVSHQHSHHDASPSHSERVDRTHLQLEPFNRAEYETTKRVSHYIHSRGRIIHEEEVERFCVLHFAFAIGQWEAEVRRTFSFLRLAERVQHSEMVARAKISMDATAAMLQVVSTAREKLVLR